MTQVFKKKLISALIAALILMAAGIGGFFYFDRIMSRPLQLNNIKIDTKAALKLDVLKQISKKNGITEWELEAASATLLKDEDKAVLIDVSVLFFTRGNKKVFLTAPKGILNTKTHDMVFSDKVTVTYETYVLKTDQLHYGKKDHIIFADTHVRLEKEDSIIEADSMIIRLNENDTILKGHVRGKFSENFDIQ